MKHPMAKFILAIILVSAVLVAFAQEKMPSMVGWQIIARTMCPLQEKSYPCVLILKDDQFYVVMFDEQGPLYLMLVVNGKDELELLWERGKT